ncbi:T9SS type A sorting domain-containing protein [Bacteroidia bacterium]|nr:T9SS type A sorting domain-containing protein [Bacteroidia bacterium]MDB9881764.1 T9SS type A sorting domain-containing protein [Bacteroidia bacterium]
MNFSEQSDLLELSRLKDNETAPKPVMRSEAIKQKLDAQRKRTAIKSKTSYITTKEDIAPELRDNFNGKPIGNAGIPNDNTMAISNDGYIISAINTTVTILNEKGERLGFKSLSGITSGQLGLLDRYYDPKVTYDPVNERFILVFLEGSLSSDTRIVVGFTETSDPTGKWSFYALNGKPLGGTMWSDYPIIAQNSTDLYITVNLLRDNESWQEGFVESLIWQVNKQDGYDGKEDLTQKVFTGIEYGGKPVWSICPVQPGLDFEHDNMYFLSVRPDAESNDTVFLHEITNSSLSGQATHTLKVLQADKKYGVPPTAYQPVVEGSDFRLQTNDTRVLSATLYNGKIHYTQSTILPDEIRSGIFHGIISDVAGDPSVSAEYISSSTLDYAYPSIAFAGEDESDEHSMILTFSHVGENDYPGTSAVFHNKKEGKESLYSDVVRLKQGDSIINTFVADTAERWGDYSDIQRKYDEPGVVWACGSYGDKNGRNNVWIAKLKVNNELLSVDGFITYPNPAETSIRVGATFTKDETVTIRLVDMRGTTVKEIKDQEVVAGSAEFLFNISGLSSGAYAMYIFNSDLEKLHSQKILVE